MKTRNLIQNGIVACGIFLLWGQVEFGVGLLQAAEADIDFQRDIRPLLSDRCIFCHGPDATERKADLRLDLESAAKGTDSEVGVIVVGKPDQSELMARITATDPDDRMPPPESGKALSDQEIQLLERWIKEGAEWSEHWAYDRPRRQTVPAVHDGEWPRNWIDHWVLSRLENEGLDPSPDADPTTLVRRLSFDLCGLAPEPGRVDAFRKNPTQGNYEGLIDSLLNQPQFGERMAAYWLDLVRYADTVGYHGDQDHNISPYRDYVIDAFNDGLPFDQFTRDQLAGDLIPDATLDQQIATGYNRLLQTSHEGGVQAKEYLAMYAADRVRNLSGVWLGATMGCAQCHDHKYDPITSKDFYAMQAFFADVDEARHLKNGTNELPTRREPEIEVMSRQERLVLASIQRDQAALEGSDQASDRSRLALLKELENRIAGEQRKIMVTRSIAPREIRLLPRGNWLDDSGPVLQPEVPEHLGRLVTDGRRPNRLDLANWLTDATDGVGLLTARVMVTRFWFLMFGAGLSRSLDDFGGQGEAPLYGDLLDQLAVEFVSSGWDIKHLFRLIATSRTYQQSSLESEELRLQDPYNRLLARQGRYRLPAESVRDSILQVAGLLDLRLGGASVKPYQPEGFYRHLNFPKRTYQAHEDGRQWRRGVYVHWQRQFLHPMMAAFDAPSREECTAQRSVSNTPVSALVLLNDPSFYAAAQSLAQRMEGEGGETRGQQIAYGFRLATSREPDSVEMEFLSGLLSPASTDSTKDVASLVLVARAILNLSEVITRH